MTCGTTVMKCKVNLESECQIVKEGTSLEGDNYDWLIFLWHRDARCSSIHYVTHCTRNSVLSGMFCRTDVHLPS